ncbi:MAG: hypothetical protein K5683_02905 [Prevotella sp.]|nr:hypothetical protein [Prevotella sp.]
MKIGDRVIVDAAVTGDGIDHHGFIEDIFDFVRESFFDVHFDIPTPWGSWGATVTNLEMIRKEI